MSLFYKQIFCLFKNISIKGFFTLEGATMFGLVVLDNKVTELIAMY